MVGTLPDQDPGPRPDRSGGPGLRRPHQGAAEREAPAGTGLTLALRAEPVDWERQVRLVVRQERAPGIHHTLAQVPDVLEERSVPLLGTTATLSVGGPHPAGHRRFDGDRVLPHVPMSRLLWAQGGIASMVCAWGLPEATLLRVASSLRPLPDAPGTS